jgi:hypothetical protein
MSCNAMATVFLATFRDCASCPMGVWGYPVACAEAVPVAAAAVCFWRRRAARMRRARRAGSALPCLSVAQMREEVSPSCYRGKERGAGLADQAGEGGVGVAAVRGEGEEGHLVHRPDLPLPREEDVGFMLTCPKSAVAIGDASDTAPPIRRIVHFVINTVISSGYSPLVRLGEGLGEEMGQPAAPASRTLRRFQAPLSEREDKQHKLRKCVSGRNCWDGG